MPRKIIAFLICFSFIFEQSGFAQVAGQFGVPGYLQQSVAISDRFRPVHIRALSFDSQNNKCDVLLDAGNAGNMDRSALSESTKQLFNYFKIGICLPNRVFWVNLRPDSPTNVIDPNLENTDLGKVLLEADLQLKKDMARFTSPDTAEGRAYWNKLYAKAEQLYGQADMEIPTLTRPWIVPGEIIIKESSNGAYIYKALLKVCLEQDYIKDSPFFNSADPRLKELNAFSSEILRGEILPKLTLAVNSTKRYAALRQVYCSLVLAQWFKQKYAGARADQALNLNALVKRIDSSDLTGLISATKWDKNSYYAAYQKSFKEGEYNKEETVNTASGTLIRSYFSGGVTMTGTAQTLPAGPGGALENVAAWTPSISMNADDIEVRTTVEQPVKRDAVSVINPVQSNLDRAIASIRDTIARRFGPRTQVSKSASKGFDGGVSEEAVVRLLLEQKPGLLTDAEARAITAAVHNLHPVITGLWNTMEDGDYSARYLAKMVADHAALIKRIAEESTGKNIETAIVLYTRQFNERRQQNVGKQIIIQFSGAPGTGKTTYLQGIAERLRSRGVELFDPQKHGSYEDYLSTVKTPIISTDEFKNSELTQALARKPFTFTDEGRTKTASGLEYYNYLMRHHERLVQTYPDLTKDRNFSLPARDQAIWDEIQRMLNPDPDGPYESQWTNLLTNAEATAAFEAGILKFHDTVRLFTMQGKSFIIESSGFNEQENRMIRILTNCGATMARVHFYADTENGQRELLLKRVIDRPANILDILVGGLSRKGIVDYIFNWINVARNAELKNTSEMVIEPFDGKPDKVKLDSVADFVEQRFAQRASDVIEALGREGYFDLKSFYSQKPGRRLQLIALIEQFLDENNGLSVFKKGEIILGPYKGDYKTRHHRGDGKYHVIMYGKARLVSQQTGLVLDDAKEQKVIPITSPAEFQTGNGFAAVAVAEDKDHWGDIQALTETATFSLNRDQFARLIKLTLEWEIEDNAGVNTFKNLSNDEMRLIQEAGLVQSYPGNPDIMRILMPNEVDKIRNKEKQSGVDVSTSPKYKIYEARLQGHQFVYKTADGAWRVFDDKIYSAAQRSNFLQYFLQGKNAQKTHFQNLYDSMANVVYLITAQNMYKEMPADRKDSEAIYEFAVSDEQRASGAIDIYMADMKATPASERSRVEIVVENRATHYKSTFEFQITAEGLIDPLGMLAGKNLDVSIIDIVKVTVFCPVEWDLYRLDKRQFDDKIEKSSGYSVENLAIDVENQGYSVINGDGQRLTELIRKTVQKAQLYNTHLLGHTDLAQKSREAVFDLVHFWVKFRNLSQASKNSGIDFTVLEIMFEEYLRHLDVYRNSKVKRDLAKYQDARARLIGTFGERTEYEDLDPAKLEEKIIEAWALLRMYLENELDPQVAGKWQYPKAKELILPYLRKGTERAVVLGSRATKQDYARLSGMPDAIIVVPDVHEQTDPFLDWALALGIVDSSDRLILSRSRVIQFQGDVANRLVGPEGMAMLKIIRDWHRQAEEFNREKNLTGNDRMQIVMTMGNQDLDILRNDSRKQTGFGGEYRVGAVKSLLQEMVADGTIVAAAYYGADANNGIQIFHAGLLPSVRRRLMAEIETHNRQVTDGEKQGPAYSADRRGMVMYMNDILLRAIEQNDFSHFIFGKSKRRGGAAEQSGIFEVDLANFNQNDLFYELVDMGILDNGGRLAEGLTAQEAQIRVNEAFGRQINGHSFDSGDSEQTRTMYRNVPLTDGAILRLAFKNVVSADTGRGQVENPYEQNTSSGVLVLAGGELYQANMDTRKPGSDDMAIKEGDASGIEYDDKLTEAQKIEMLSRKKAKPQPKVLISADNSLRDRQDVEELTGTYDDIAGFLDTKLLPTRDIQLLSEYGKMKQITGNIGSSIQEGDVVIGLSGTFQIKDSSGKIVCQETIKGRDGNRGRVLARGPPLAEWNIVTDGPAMILIVPAQVAQDLSLPDLLAQNPSLENTLRTLIPSAFSKRYLDIVRYKNTISTIVTDIRVAGAKIFAYLESPRKADKTDGRKIGIFPISANPFHLNHAKVILKTLTTQDLDEVMVVVSPHHVSKKPLSALELALRVAMIKATFQFDPRVSIVVIGDSYYKNIARIIKEQEPHANLYLMMGMDNFEDTISRDAFAVGESPKEEIQAILNSADILVSTRNGKGDEYLTQLLQQAGIQLPQAQRDRIHYHEIVQDNVSSSLVRILVADGEDGIYPDFMDTEASALIRDFSLYQGQAVSDDQRRQVYSDSKTLINWLWKEDRFKHPEKWEQLVIEDSMQLVFKQQLQRYYTELFGSADILKDVSPDVWLGLSEWNETTKKVIMARMADGLAVFESLFTIRAQALQFFNKFAEQNPGTGKDDILNKLAKWTHQAWLGLEKRNPGFVAYNQDIHNMLLKYAKRGLVVDSKGKAVTAERAEDLQDKFRFLPMSIYEKLSDADKKEFLAEFRAATITPQEPQGKEELTKDMVINTVGGEWDVLNNIQAQENKDPEWAQKRAKFLFGLQRDGVAAVLSCLSDQELLNELTSGDRARMENALINMMRRVNLVWRLNNPWNGIGDPLLSKPFDLKEKDGIGEDEILKDAVVLKMILATLQDPDESVIMDAQTLEKLDLAYAKGLDKILEDLTAPDMQALIKAIKSNVVETLNKFPATTGEYATVLSDVRSMQRYTNSADIWAALDTSDKAKLGVITRRMTIALAVFESLVTIKMQALQFYNTFAEKNPGIGKGAILNKLAEVTHQAWLGLEKRNSGFVAYNQDMHNLLLKYAAQEGLVADSKGKAVTPARVEDPGDKFRFLPMSIYDKLNAAQKKEFSAAFRMATVTPQEPKGKEELTTDMVINTVGGEWTVLNSIKAQGNSEKWAQERTNTLFKLQRDSVAAVLSGLADPAILDALAGNDEAVRVNALINMMRRVNLVWRLNNPWSGISDPLLSKPFDLAENGGIGVEDIQKDTVVLREILMMLHANQDITLPGNIRGKLNLAFEKGLGDQLDNAIKEDKGFLIKAIQQNRGVLLKEWKEGDFDARIEEAAVQLQTYYPSLLPVSVIGFALAHDGGESGRNAGKEQPVPDGGDIKHVAFVGMFSELQPQLSTTAALYALASHVTSLFPGIQASTFDMYADHSLTVDGIAQALIDDDVGVVSLTITHNTVDNAKTLFDLINAKARTAGKKAPLIVLGGAIPSFLPQELLKNYFTGAYVIRGEGEEPLSEFIKFAQGQASLESVHSLVYIRADGSVLETEKSAGLDLNNMHRLSEGTLLKMVELHKRGAMVYIEASRGCPWGHCQFCAGRNMYGGWRGRNVEDVAEEITFLVNNGVLSLHFSDEEFFGRDIGRAAALAQALLGIREKTGQAFTFSISARADSIFNDEDSADDSARRKEILAQLHKAGLNKVFLGIESGSPTQLKRYNKGMSVNEAENAARIVKQELGPAGLDVGFIMFDPEVTFAEVRQNADFIFRNKLLDNISWFLNKLKISTGTPMARRYENKSRYPRIDLSPQADINMLTFDYSLSEHGMADFVKYAEYLFEYSSKLNYALKSIRWSGVLDDMLQEEYDESIALLNALQYSMFGSFENMIENALDGSVKDKVAAYEYIRADSLQKQVRIVQASLAKLDSLAKQHPNGAAEAVVIREVKAEARNFLEQATRKRPEAGEKLQDAALALLHGDETTVYRISNVQQTAAGQRYEVTAEKNAIIDKGIIEVGTDSVTLYDQNINYIGFVLTADAPTAETYVQYARESIRQAQGRADKKELLARAADSYSKAFENLQGSKKIDLAFNLKSSMASGSREERIAAALCLLNVADIPPSDGAVINEDVRIEALRIVAQEKEMIIRYRDLPGVIDLHCHTFRSDGSVSPSYVVFDSWRRGLRAVGVVDHNTATHMYEALQAGRILGIDVIVGAEFDVFDYSLGIKNFHIVGYFSPGSDASLGEYMKTIDRAFGAGQGDHKSLQVQAADFISRNSAKIDHYRNAFNGNKENREKGLELLEEDLWGYMSAFPNRYQLGKALFAKYGARRLGVNDFRTAANRYFPKGSLDVDGEDGVFIEDVISFFRKTNAAIVLPHPGENMSGKPMFAAGQVDSVLAKYESIGAIEVFSSKHNAADEASAKRQTRQFGRDGKPLYISNGSDAHDGNGILLGKGDVRENIKGNLPTPQSPDYAAITEFLGFVKAGSAAGGGTRQGGIDFRALPIMTPRPGQGHAMAKARVVQDMDKEWLAICKQMRGKQMPYARMKEYVAMCGVRQGSANNIEAVRMCVRDILKLEEGCAVETSAEMKEIMVMLEVPERSS